jgi:hypothetical protein
MQSYINCNPYLFIEQFGLSPLLIQIANAIASRPEACQVLVQHRLKRLWAHVSVIRTVVSSCCKTNALRRCYLSRRCIAHVVQPAMPRWCDCAAVIVVNVCILYPSVCAKGVLSVLIVLVARRVCANVLANFDLSYCVHLPQHMPPAMQLHCSDIFQHHTELAGRSSRQSNKFQQEEWLALEARMKRHRQLLGFHFTKTMAGKRSESIVSLP